MRNTNKQTKSLDYQALKLSGLSDIIETQLKTLTVEERQACHKLILQFLNKPTIDTYKLSVIANKMMIISADYDDYVSISIFKLLPSSYTLSKLKKLEEELYKYISDFILGQDLDKAFTQVLINETKKKYPDINPEQVKQKALGNWGWLLPHALMQLIVGQVNDLIKQSTLDNKKKNRKGRIRIKKM